MNSGKLSENYFSGKIYAYSSLSDSSTAYAGGIAGLTPEGIITNSHSEGNIFTEASVLYSGGIVGYNQLALIQNTYTLSSISALCDEPDGYAGGIVGFSEGGVISENVAVNRSISGNAVAGRVACFDDGTVICQNNYYDRSAKIDAEVRDFEGAVATENAAMTREFFFTPVSDGGKLGWSTEIWSIDNEHIYPSLKNHT